MTILTLFAFLAGIVTILSPCILPLLPIILSGTIGGGHKRPLGIIAGFVASFTFFTLFLASLVQAIGISADTLRLVSVVVIALFGVALITPFVQKFSEILFSKLSNVVPKQKTSQGFLGGVLIGVSLGLVWTPCVGPIIASVITLAATSSVTLNSVLITFAYSLGTAIPMLLIMQGGRASLQKFPWLLRNTSTIQKLFGVLMLLTAIGIFFGVDRRFQSYILEVFPGYGAGLTQFEDQEFIRQRLDTVSEESALPLKGQNIKAPALIEGGEWVNSEPLVLKDLQGRVVLIDFWTYTCINCIRTLPYLKSWHEKYKDDGLVIIGVHTPEFEFEKNPDNLKAAINDYELSYPIMQDNDYSTWKAYRNRYWPAKYLIDKDGYIRYTHFGEGAYDETEKVIQMLLSETGSAINEDINNPEYEVNTATPELYLGYKRLHSFSSPEDVVTGNFSDYSLPTFFPPNTFSFIGHVNITEEYSAPQKATRLVLKFDAKEVFMVAATDSEGVGEIKVTLDGNEISTENSGEDLENGILKIQEKRLYDIVDLDTRDSHTLELEFNTSNIQVFTFTFG